MNAGPGPIVVLGEGRLGRSLHAAIGAAGLCVHGAPARRPPPVDVLAPLSARGCPVGSFHPFQPFASERPPSAFRGATIGVEASDERLGTRLEQLAGALGAQARRVPARVYRALGIAACELAIDTGLEQATAGRIARSLTTERTASPAPGAAS